MSECVCVCVCVRVCVCVCMFPIRKEVLIRTSFELFFYSDSGGEDSHHGFILSHLGVNMLLLSRKEQHSICSLALMSNSSEMKNNRTDVMSG